MPDSDALSRFGRALVDALAAQNMTRAELAEQVGRSASAVTNYTLGRDTPTPEVVFAMERALALPDGQLSRILGFCPCDEIPTFEQALMADPRLPSDQKQFLLGIYRGILRP